MNIIIPKNFVMVDAEEFKLLLLSINWKRDAYSNGEYFRVVGSGRRFAVRTTDDNHYVDPDLLDPT